MESALRTQLLPAFGRMRLDRVDRAAIQDWFDDYSMRAPAGANRALDILRQILNFAVACGYLDLNPASGIRPNPKPRRTRFLSRREVRRIHASLDSHRSRGSGTQQAEIIRLLLLTGCRKGELVHLRWSEVMGRTLRLNDSKTGPRLVHLSDEALRIVRRQPRAGSPFVFPCLKDDSMPRSNELSLWRKVRREAGIEDVRLHDLRHTFASHAVMCRVPLPVVSRLLGHSSERMALRYAHVGDREAEEAAERIGSGLADLLGLPRPD